MANSLLTIDMITREALRLAHEKATFLGTINRQFDDSFGKSNGKIGDTLRIRLPSQYSRRQGSRVMAVQDAEEQNTRLVVATQDGVDMRFNSRELALDLENFSKIHLEPAMATLISGIESDVLQGVTKLVWNVAGTAGTAVTSLTAPGLARAKLNQNLAPKDGNRAIQMDSVTMQGLVANFAAYFNPSGAISEQYREGFIARTSMADYYENERVWNLTNGSDVSGVGVDGYTIVNGDTDITVSGWTAGSTTAGQVFTIANMYDCHPETKAAYAHLKQHVILAGTTSTSISTYPIYLSGPRKNVAAVDGSDLAASTVSGAALTFVGAASTTYTQTLMYHKDAFTFATADLPLMTSAEKCVRRMYDGISLRVWQDGDIRNDELLTRIDILYGYAAIRPQWACRLIGAAAS